MKIALNLLFISLITIVVMTSVGVSKEIIVPGIKNAVSGKDKLNTKESE